MSVNAAAPSLEGVGLALNAEPRQHSRLWRSLRQNWAAVIGCLLLTAMVLMAVLASVIGPYDPMVTSLGLRLRPVGTAGHILGTDALGRDLLTRIMYGGRVSLSIGALAVVISGTVGITLGLISGYYGGFWDRLIFRLANIQLGMPFLLLAIAIIAVLGPSLRNLVIVLSLGGWVLYARVVRGQVFSVREREHVEAARAIGQSDVRIILRHILPNVLSPVIVIASFAVAQNIILESALSFLGLGAPPDVPSWGAMLADGRTYLATAWWLSTLPGVAIMLSVLSINLIGDWLQDYLDPQFAEKHGE